MDKLTTNKTRYPFIDSIKMFACLLVVVGHLLSGLKDEGILEATSAFNIFNLGIYSFHVALFFICSGFLYQYKNHVNSFKSWAKNILEKLVNLGVPFLVFTIVSIVIKTVLSKEPIDVNEIVTALFINPIAPYWYLYVLFILFVITPCFKNLKGNVIVTIIALAVKTIYVFALADLDLPYVIKAICNWWFWFALGMALSRVRYNIVPLLVKVMAIASFVGGCALAVKFYYFGEATLIKNYLCSFPYVFAVIILFVSIDIKSLDDLSNKFSKYFMPVFLMHNIFIAGTRSILIKVGVSNSIIHIALGLVIGILVPMFIYFIVEKIPFVEFFIYPKKAISKLRGKHE